MQPSSDVISTSSLSRRLWDLDWTRTLPWTFDDVIVDVASYDEALPFIGEHYPTIFPTGSEARFLPQPLSPSKRRFGAEMDVFLFRSERQVVGVVIAHPSDWTTYYLRSVAFLRAYRGRRLFGRFLDGIRMPLLEAGVERLESECSPANAAMTRTLSRQEYLLTSMSSSERWGLLARYTHFLSGEARASFAKQFCLSPP
jgi:hypothetical protein